MASSSYPLTVLPGGDSPPHSAKRFATARAMALRLYRLLVVVAIVWMVHRHHARLRIDSDAPIQVDEVRPFLPTAVTLDLDTSERQGLLVRDDAGRRIGYVLRTAPVSNSIIGYAGATDTLIVLDAAMRVVGIHIRHSEDTKTHVSDVAGDQYFMKTWTGKTWDQVAGMDPHSAGIEGVSGASLTSLAIANGIQQRFAHALQAGSAKPSIHFGWSDAAIVVLIAVALLFAFTHLRGQPRFRRSFQVVLIGYLGLVNGRLLAQSLFGGWAESEIPWRLAPGLVLLAAAALILPWTSRRAVYCSHLCPHGAAQEWLNRFFHRKPALPRGVEAGLRWVPPLLIALVLFFLMVPTGFDLASIEPFDAYLFRTAGMATICIALGGLAISLFVPMAYCKYGCPTGALLNFVRSHGKADRFGRRDLSAALLVLLTAILYARYDTIHHWIFR